MNTVILLGNTGSKPILNQTSTGRSVVKFDLAVDSYSGDNKYTDWFKCECWAKAGVSFLSQYGFQGQLLLIEGSLRTQQYEQDGDTKYITKIVVSKVQGLSYEATEAIEDIDPSLIERLQTAYASAIQ